MIPSGVDILRSKGGFSAEGDIGTLPTGSLPGSSIFVDVAAGDGGMFSALDSKRGRIFTYDKDGNLLFVFGGLGSQRSNFRTPSAIGLMGKRMLVLDRDNNRLSIFSRQTMEVDSEAVVSLYEGKADQATAAWEKVLQLNGNFEVAYIGIGSLYEKRREPGSDGLL